MASTLPSDDLPSTISRVLVLSCPEQRFGESLHLSPFPPEALCAVRDGRPKERGPTYDPLMALSPSGGLGVVS